MWAWQRDDGSWYDASATHHSRGMKPLYASPPPAEPAVEPFGYFRAEPFGWTDCAPTDEGAKALYEVPPPAEPAVEPFGHRDEMDPEKHRQYVGELIRLRKLAVKEGLWLPHMPKEWGGMGLGHVALAMVQAEAAKTRVGPWVFNCQAPDEGNMHTLVHWATPEQKEKYRQYEANNKEKRSHQSRFTTIERKYGLSKDAYDRLLVAQGNKCKICGLLETENTFGYLYVDHCHTTNKIRGLLCHNCNSMLGYAKDNQTTLFTAIEYLRENSNEEV